MATDKERIAELEAEVERQKGFAKRYANALVKQGLQLDAEGARYMKARDERDALLVQMAANTTPLYWFQFDPAELKTEEPPKSLTELRTRHENAVLEVLGKMPEAQKLIAYKQLHSEGARIDEAELKLRKLLSDEWRAIKAQANTP